ncbi:MAG: hypothetical protein ACPHUL_00215 [Marinomonas gallaica]
MNITLTEIRKAVLASGGTYKKVDDHLNGKPAWVVNGKCYTLEGLRMAFSMGRL